MKLYLAEVAYLHGDNHYRIVRADSKEEAEEKVDREYCGGATTLDVTECIE